MCSVLGASKSGYYDWLKRGISSRKKRKIELMRHIEDLHQGSRKIYGSPRITRLLKGMGYRIAQSTVALWMTEAGIVSKTKKKFKVLTTDSRHSHPIAPNILDRKFNPQSPNAVWASDITYVPTQEGWLYLAVTIDLYSRMVVGWSMGSNMSRELVLSSFRMALKRRRGQLSTTCIHHSDRGSQYASGDFRQALDRHGFICSMSGKGNCWDNAVVESFFHTLKTEHIFLENYLTRQDAVKSIFEYIEVFYNRKRIHSSLDYKSPLEFEEKFAKCA